jgi:signal transduction histidine kinase
VTPAKAAVYQSTPPTSQRRRVKAIRLDPESADARHGGTNDAGRIALMLGLDRAAATACATLAASAKRTPDDVRRQIEPVIGWLAARISTGSDASGAGAPPIVSQEVTEVLRSQIVCELAECTSLRPADVLRLMAGLEELVVAWRATDRGRFMTRLTGPESANALVAIAHDIRSPLASILILVDSLRRGRGSEC